MQRRRVCWPEEGRAVVEPFEPRGLRADEVLIETEVTLISPGTERAFFLGLPNARRQLPYYPGYSNVGRVLAAGDGVPDLAPGERVVSAGNHASHVVTRAVRCSRVPEGLAPEEAVYFSLAAIALQGVRKARIELGEAALVVGLGLIGNLALQLARLQGAFPALGSDPDGGRRDLARRCGADRCFDPTAEGFAGALREAVGGRGPAVVIEATGNAAAVNACFELAGDHARVLLLASTRGTAETNFYADVHRRGLILLGAHGNSRPAFDSSPGYWTLEDDIRTVLRLLAAGRLDVRILTSEVLPADEAPRAYEDLATWRTDRLGVVLDWRG